MGQPKRPWPALDTQEQADSGCRKRVECLELEETAPGGSWNISQVEEVRQREGKRSKDFSKGRAAGRGW